MINVWRLSYLLFGPYRRMWLFPLAQRRGLQVSSSIDGADIALLRLGCPYEERPGGFEKLFHAGSLEYSAEEMERQAEISESAQLQ